ncbi:MAG: trypsin-like peptidase domain-containing protein [Planctomycetota bacterium]
MRGLRSIGPAVVLSVSVVASVWFGPFLVEELTFIHDRARTDAARQRLVENPQLTNLSNAFADVAQAVEPSLVHIEIRPEGARLGDGRPASNGSGWVYDDLGRIITNRHVVQPVLDQPGTIRVRFANDVELTAEVLGADYKTDIAVLQIDTDRLIPAIRSVAPVRQGQIVFAFGSPLGYQFSMSQGVVSADDRELDFSDDRFRAFIQTDAAINPGNSGGPLTDVQGRVVGMNTAIAAARTDDRSERGTFLGLGFAIPVRMIEDVAERIIRDGKVRRGYLGVLIDDLTPSLAETFGYGGKGVLIAQVLPGSPAERAGMRDEDIVITVDGHAVETPDELRYRIGRIEPGAQATLEVFRDGARRSVRVTLIELPDERDALARSGDSGPDADAELSGLRRLGIREARRFTPRLAERFGIAYRPQAVLLVDVAPGSPADEAGLTPGLLIVDVSGQGVATPAELDARIAAAESGQPIRFRALRWRAGFGSYQATFHAVVKP